MSLHDDDIYIVRVVSDFIPLFKQGNNWVGKCPWCSVDQLTVSPEHEVFYCFYCAAGGNWRAFVDRLPAHLST